MKFKCVFLASRSDAGGEGSQLATVSVKSLEDLVVSFKDIVIKEDISIWRDQEIMVKRVVPWPIEKAHEELAVKDVLEWLSDFDFEVGDCIGLACGDDKLDFVFVCLGE